MEVKKAENFRKNFHKLSAIGKGLPLAAELEINPIQMDGWIDGWMALIHPSIRKIQIARMAIRVRPKLLV